MPIAWQTAMILYYGLGKWDLFSSNSKYEASNCDQARSTTNAVCGRMQKFNQQPQTVTPLDPPNKILLSPVTKGPMLSSHQV